MEQVIKEKNSWDKRNSNFELFRIILMLLIIAHHYTVNSGLTDLFDFNNITQNMIFLQIFGMWGKAVINCFYFNHRILYGKVQYHNQEIYKDVFGS